MLMRDVRYASSQGTSLTTISHSLLRAPVCHVCADADLLPRRSLWVHLNHARLEHIGVPVEGHHGHELVFATGNVTELATLEAQLDGVRVVRVVTFWILGEMADGWRDADDLGFLMGLETTAVVLAPMAVDSRLKKWMRAAVEATDAGTVRDGQGLVFAERWKAEKRHRLESRMRAKLRERQRDRRSGPFTQ